MTKIFSTRTLTLTAAAAFGLIVAAPAGAQTSEAPISISVQYADLNLNHAAGANMLLQRINSAAVRACGGAPDIRLPAQRSAFDQCRKAAVSQAVAEVNSPVLTAMVSHNPTPVTVASR